ncbi:type II toxin-antitoxin system RnlA family toxin [Sulfuricurvum sp.]|uniref:type II toxin-antitoxin system RnlA family toxin n=1 Tax=Sulfuricurvum sp. TaxID=2025608 RepID=UPI002634C1C0|nr:type II toxin-antitoxin system RnlA family toxin [Sulfuricurvum sp.]MDD2781231.1 type II toxin-antitoxin system RnlA family toxin [Sulfuricurvum sp.]
MAAFKKLNLDFGNIANSIKSFSGVTSVQEGKPNWVIQCDGKEVILSIWLIGDGTTTINPDVGKYQDLGLQITEHIIAKCKTSDAKSVTSSIRYFKEEDFELIIHYLKEAIEELDIQIYDLPSGKKYELKNKQYKDSFTLIKHNNGTLQLQGKPLSVYRELYAILSELVSIEEIISINNAIHKVNLEKADVYAELEFEIPVAYTKLCNTTKKILMASIALKKIDIELDDYGSFVFGALRGLEAFMKLIIKQKYRTVASIGELFKYNSVKFEIVLDFAEHVNSFDTVRVMENCYNFYNQNRHGIFHADNMPEMSRIINKIEADRIISTVCKLIEEGSNEI